MENEAAEEVASNNENEANEPVPVENSLFVEELAGDASRAGFDHYWMNSDWIEAARQAGVDYIQQRCIILGLKTQTAYLGIINLTRFLSLTRGLEDMMSVACLSISAKMEEDVVPPLSSFRVNTLSNGIIMMTELLVLEKLRWNMRVITPFAFTGLFAERLTEIFEVGIVSSRVEYVIMCSMKDVKCMCYRPSVMAFAATLVAVTDYVPRTTTAMRLRIEPLVTELEMNIVKVIACYTRVLQMIGQPRTRHLGRPRVSVSTVVRGRGMEHTRHLSWRM